MATKIKSDRLFADGQYVVYNDGRVIRNTDHKPDWTVKYKPPVRLSYQIQGM